MVLCHWEEVSLPLDLFLCHAAAIKSMALLVFKDWREKWIKYWNKKQGKQCRANSQREIPAKLWNI